MTHHLTISSDSDDNEPPPDWVARDAVCLRLWHEHPEWRVHALDATGYPATEQLLVKLAYRACGGSEGEAVG